MHNKKWGYLKNPIWDTKIHLNANSAFVVDPSLTMTWHSFNVVAENNCLNITPYIQGLACLTLKFMTWRYVILQRRENLTELGSDTKSGK